MFVQRILKVLEFWVFEYKRIDQWLDDLDGDKLRRCWLVKNLINNTRFRDDDFTPKVLAVTLLQHTKACDKIDPLMLDMGELNILHSETLKNPSFLRNVWGELACICRL